MNAKEKFYIKNIGHYNIAEGGIVGSKTVEEKEGFDLYKGNKKEFIKSYNHLESKILLVIEESPEPLSAHQIKDRLLSNYNTGQVKINPRSIAGRLKGNSNIRVIRGSRENYYSYRRPKS